MTGVDSGIPRTIQGFSRDDEGDFMARLDCGHVRHVRHHPPLSSYPWVEDEEGRNGRVGRLLECESCGRLELPEDAVVYKTTASFDESTTPDGLRARHRVRKGSFGRLVLESGALTLRYHPPLDTERAMVAGDSAVLPPLVEHEVVLSGPVRFRVEFLRVPDSSV